MLIWIFFNNILIHGPTKEKTHRALDLVMEAALDVGLLCHPNKCPPLQEVKYLGFLLNTVAAPTLITPQDKQEWALAMVNFLLSCPSNHQFSWLSLAVAVGVLQSLVEVTPSQLGHTYLRNFHNVVHPSGLGTGVDPYLATSALPLHVHSDLVWWQQFLRNQHGQVVCPSQAGTLVPMWGDSSGPGTGFTKHLLESPL